MVAEEMLLSVEDVNQRLPLVRTIVRDIMELHHDITLRKDRLSSLRERYPVSSSADSVYEQEVLQMEAELCGDEVRLEGFAQELHQIGGTLTDRASGIVDFRGGLDGERVQLCWQSDEPEVLFWHSGDCGKGVRVSLYHELNSGGFATENDLRQDA
ncbi:MAG: DUF2203 family protein [Planctomycetota bacterium]|nr:DUF2203 family protein [Planctomycetota bacterium]